MSIIGDSTEGSATMGLAEFIFEVGHLKLVPRTGWQYAGITDPESVAEHSHRVAVLAFLLATLEGGNAERAACLGLFHDVPEARTGDIASVGKPYLKKASDIEVAREQTSTLPEQLSTAIQEIIAEYASGESVEAKAAKDADRIECLAQAIEYRDRGNARAGYWVESMLESVRTASGRDIAREVASARSDSWWSKFVKTYRSA